MNLNFRKANFDDAEQIWKIIQQAIERRRIDGSKQWQDGYPNPETIQSDIQKNYGYVLTDSEKIIGYSAIIFNNEPAYEKIDGKWLTESDFLVVHRVAISEEYIGKGLAQKIFSYIEEVAKENKIPSIKVDTNFDNLAMLKILEKLNYQYCGEVFLRSGVRKAFEKIV